MPTAIDGLSKAGTPPTSLTPQGSSRLGKDEFLKLLVTQLSNQDPLSPVDNQAFIAQLAQFATVEQQSQMNSTLESLLLAQASSNQTNVANLVGREITFTSDKVVIGETGGAQLNARLSADAAKVSAIIKDENGKVVRSITVGSRNGGPLTLPWDGRDNNGNPLRPGSYTVTFTAADLQGKSVDVTTQGRGRATGVSFADGVPQLVVNGVRVRLSDVLEVNEPKSNATSTTTT
ncbi:MAG: flagellar hook assembly protein FlgD [Myxococcaceae bacterium]|jgi:flagellar basal-body rod modification protein FlgD|nr:flagellar hook assembly protein FlgD [Myxococcaceae bacterium]